MSINRVEISGNLTRDPELRATAAGTSVLQFGMAVNDRRKNQQTGEWEDKPNFVDCVMFGQRAQSVSRFLQKGGKVAVAGKLSWSQWQANDGSKRSKLEVVVDDIELMSRSESQPVAQPAYRQPVQQAPQQVQPQPVQQAPQPVQPQYVEATLYDENVPF